MPYHKKQNKTKQNKTKQKQKQKRKQQTNKQKPEYPLGLKVALRSRPYAATHGHNRRHMLRLNV